MKCYRRILKIAWREKKTNKFVRSQCVRYWRPSREESSSTVDIDKEISTGKDYDRRKSGR